MNEEIREILDEIADLNVPIASLHDRDDLYAAGLSSISTIGLMLAIEGRFKIEIPDEMITRNLFRSIDALVQAVAMARRDSKEA
jgi:acyl carrier protein